MSEQHLIRVSEAAAMAAVSRQTIYEMINAGILPFVRIGKTQRDIRIRYDAFLRWIEQNTEQHGLANKVAITVNRRRH